MFETQQGHRVLSEDSSQPMLPLVDGTQSVFQITKGVPSFQKHKYMEPHGKPATQQPEAIIVPQVPLDGELRGHAPSTAQAGFNSVWGGLKCQLFRITTRLAPFQSAGLERPQEGPGRKELCLWCPQPPAGSPRWEMRSQKHGPSQETIVNTAQETPTLRGSFLPI